MRFPGNDQDDLLCPIRALSGATRALTLSAAALVNHWELGAVLQRKHRWISVRWITPVLSSGNHFDLLFHVNS